MPRGNVGKKNELPPSGKKAGQSPSELQQRGGHTPEEERKVRSPLAKRKKKLSFEEYPSA